MYQGIRTQKQQFTMFDVICQQSKGNSGGHRDYNRSITKTHRISRHIIAMITQHPGNRVFNGGSAERRARSRRKHGVVDVSVGEVCPDVTRERVSQHILIGT